MTSYIFHEAGSIPGIPGTFAHCRIEVDEDGNVETTPLPLHPDPAYPTEEPPPPQENATDPASDHPPEAPAQETPIFQAPEAALDTPQAQEGA